MKKRFLLCICLLLLLPVALEADTAQQLEQAEELVEGGKLDEAEGILQGVVSEGGPDAILGQGKLVELYITAGKDANTQAAYDDLLGNFSSDPRLPKAVDNVADAWRQIRNFQRARTVYQYMVTTWPDAEHAIDSQRGVVQTSLLLGDWDYVDESLDKLMEDYGDHANIADALDSLAGEFRKSRRYDQARDLYMYVVENRPQAEEAVSCLGGAIRLNFLLGDDPNAEALTERLLTEYVGNEELPAVFDEVADEYRLAGKYEKARSLYRRAVQTWPGTDRSVESQKSVVLCSISLKDEPNAVADTEQLTAELSTTDSPERSAVLTDALVKIAEGYEQAENHDRAKAIYLQAMTGNLNSGDNLDQAKAHIFTQIKDANDTGVEEDITRFIADYNDHPALAEALFEMGEQHYYVRQYQPAIRVWKYVFDNCPKAKSRSEIPYLLATCHRCSNQSEEAIKYYRISLEQYPQAKYSYRVPYRLGVQYRDVGKPGEALYWLGRQRELYPDPLYVERACFEEVAIHYWNLGDYPLTIGLANEYLSEYPDGEHAWPSYYLIAKSYEQMGDRSQAVAVLEEALQEFKGTKRQESITEQLTRMQEGGAK